MQQTAVLKKCQQDSLNSECLMRRRLQSGKNKGRPYGIFQCNRKRAGSPYAFRRRVFMAALSMALGMADEIQKILLPYILI